MFWAVRGGILAFSIFKRALQPMSKEDNMLQNGLPALQQTGLFGMLCKPGLVSQAGKIETREEQFLALIFFNIADYIWILIVIFKICCGFHLHCQVFWPFHSQWIAKYSVNNGSFPICSVFSSLKLTSWLTVSCNFKT